MKYVLLLLVLWAAYALWRHQRRQAMRDQRPLGTAEGFSLPDMCAYLPRGNGVSGVSASLGG